jgi:hypothetical protein
MGIIGATRDRGSDLGGWAINIEHLEAALNSLNISLPPLNDDWRRAQDAQRRQSEATTLTPGTAPRSATRRPFQAPSLPRHYVERSTALSQVLRRLTAQGSHVNNAIAITAVHGLGGIGKSSLAAAVANSSEARSQFPDGVLWATLGQEPQLLPLLLSWIQAVGGPHNGPCRARVITYALHCTIEPYS